MSRNSDVFEPIAPPADVLCWLEENWGIASHELVDGYVFYRRRGREDTWIGPPIDANPLPSGVHTLGTMITRERPPGGYPASGFLRRFGHLATRRRLELEGERAARFLAGTTQRLDEVADWSKGYVVVMIDGICAGRGLVREGELLCEVPKNLRLR